MDGPPRSMWSDCNHCNPSGRPNHVLLPYNSIWIGRSYPRSGRSACNYLSLQRFINTLRQPRPPCWSLVCRQKPALNDRNRLSTETGKFPCSGVMFYAGRTDERRPTSQGTHHLLRLTKSVSRRDCALNTKYRVFPSRSEKRGFVWKLGSFLRRMESSLKQTEVFGEST